LKLAIESIVVFGSRDVLLVAAAVNVFILGSSIGILFRR